MSWCVKVDTLGRLCDDDLERLYNHFITTNIYLIGAAYNSYLLIIYKSSSLIISPWTFSTLMGIKRFGHETKVNARSERQNLQAASQLCTKQVGTGEINQIIESLLKVKVQRITKTY